MQTIDWRIILLIVNSLILLFLIYNLGRYTFCKKIHYLFLSIRFKTRYFLIGNYNRGLSLLDPDLLKYKNIYLTIANDGIRIRQVGSLRKPIFLPYENMTKVDIVLRDNQTPAPVDEYNLPVFMKDLRYILIEYVLSNVKQQELITISFNCNDNIYPFNNYIYTKFNPLKKINEYITGKLIVSYVEEGRSF
ncbi:MAG: hypothetical protein GYA50_03050 [Eubacteriaceae bacterium]|nr:hypothetical protein [Eubacteriaceae bacterium]